MNSLYEQPPTLAPPVVAATLVVSAAAAASAALAIVGVHSAAIAASTLSTIIHSIASLLILFGSMILLITKDMGIIRKLYNSMYTIQLLLPRSGDVLVLESGYHLDLEFSLFDPYPLLLKWQKYWLSALGSSTSESTLGF
ncbi:hypothetical protein Tco_0865301 [Tanacetum coccineum]